MAAIINKYKEKLESLPPSGGGGCHVALLGVANLGVMAGLEDDRILEDIRENIDDSRRPVPDNEILSAIDRARRDHADLDRNRPNRPRSFGEQVGRRPSSRMKCGAAALGRIIDAGRGARVEDLLAASPVRLPNEPILQSVSLLEALYRPTDLLFMGPSEMPGIKGRSLLTAEQWLFYFRRKCAPPPHIIPNPLTGESAPTRAGDKTTLRGDRCVEAFRFAVVEFDNLGREDQLAFWAGAKLPVHALIDTGGKSIHGWVAIQDIQTLEEWDLKVKMDLFDDLLVPLGVDGSCKNAARLSRMPGHRRDGKVWQRCLYLDPKGRRMKL